MFMIVVDEPEAAKTYWRWAWTAQLGLPLFIALTLFAEQRFSSAARHVFALAAGGLVLASLFVGWGFWTDEMRLARYAQAAVALHLLVAFLPLLRWGRPAWRVGHNAFWQYNRRLFERFLLAALYSASLFVGLALALLAIGQLFEIDIAEETYMRFWFGMALIFHPWFFLAGVPKDLAALEEVREYPSGLKTFAQYVLLPIVALYLTILTVYLGKVLVTWDWPSGWIGYLVTIAAAAGILSILLIQPFARKTGNEWVATYVRGFWIALLPSIVMLWLAIGQRINQYGVTESRYFVVVLSIWLAGTALYYGITRSRNLRIIPVSLFLLTALTFFGPWGAYSISENSQLQRFESLLAQENMLADGHVKAAAQDVPLEARAQMSAVLRYLARTHGTGEITEWFVGAEGVSAPSVEPAMSADNTAQVYMEALELEYVERYGGPARPPTDHFSARARIKTHIPLSGFDYLLQVEGTPESVQAGGEPGRESGGESGGESDAGPSGSALSVQVAPDAAALEVLQGDRGLVTIRLDSLIARVRARPGDDMYPTDSLRVEAANDSAGAVVYIRNMRGVDTDQGLELQYIDADILVRVETP